ncbi:unnamed protein product [Cyprideis torosa]|uniref:Uncharacterized protein n=1 Tax=Cyprideis torosa TaxID=163714 RepID=A0A7R8ZHC8_9CRUS|nr:unnamed protein product [Cyprideis torosa]CAG0883393.1 unnamed protein product [Cyprideis torosa]
MVKLSTLSWPIALLVITVSGYPSRLSGLATPFSSSSIRIPTGYPIPLLTSSDWRKQHEFIRYLYDASQYLSAAAENNGYSSPYDIPRQGFNMDAIIGSIPWAYLHNLPSKIKEDIKKGGSKNVQIKQTGKTNQAEEDPSKKNTLQSKTQEILHYGTAKVTHAVKDPSLPVKISCKLSTKFTAAQKSQAVRIPFECESCVSITDVRELRISTRFVDEANPLSISVVLNGIEGKESSELRVPLSSKAAASPWKVKFVSDPSLPLMKDGDIRGRFHNEDLEKVVGGNSCNLALQATPIRTSLGHATEEFRLDIKASFSLKGFEIGEALDGEDETFLEESSESQSITEKEPMSESEDDEDSPKEIEFEAKESKSKEEEKKSSPSKPKDSKAKENDKKVSSSKTKDPKAKENNEDTSSPKENSIRLQLQTKNEGRTQWMQGCSQVVFDPRGKGGPLDPLPHESSYKDEVYKSGLQNFLDRVVFETVAVILVALGAISVVSQPICMYEVSMNSQWKDGGRGRLALDRLEKN